jgi:hypothetical protein
MQLLFGQLRNPGWPKRPPFPVRFSGTRWLVAFVSHLGVWPKPAKVPQICVTWSPPWYAYSVEENSPPQNFVRPISAARTGDPAAPASGCATGAGYILIPPPWDPLVPSGVAFTRYPGWDRLLLPSCRVESVSISDGEQV